MSRAILKRSLSEAGAFLDESNGGSDTLLAVLQALAASSGETIGYSQAVPTTGIKGAILCDTPTTLSTIYVRAAVAGSAGVSTFKVSVNGEEAVTISIDNAEADDTAKGLAIGRPLEPGDLVELEVSAVGTGASGLSATVRLKPVTVES